MRPFYLLVKITSRCFCWWEELAVAIPKIIVQEGKAFTFRSETSVIVFFFVIYKSYLDLNCRVSSPTINTPPCAQNVQIVHTSTRVWLNAELLKEEHESEAGWLLDARGSYRSSNSLVLSIRSKTTKEKQVEFVLKANPRRVDKSLQSIKHGKPLHDKCPILPPGLL